jgi:hypothetical protein
MLVPVEGVTVAPAAEYAFDFTVVAPPMTTMRYALPLTPTGVADVDTLDCNWILAGYDELILTDEAAEDTVVSRFPDIQPGTAGAWARFDIEECAGRVPVIVMGFENGTYRPAVQVSRDAMAVYIFRTLKLVTQAYEGRFTDIASDHWAWGEIEALVRAGIVQGFENDTYRPALIVNRGTMAVYVSRALVGGPDVPTGPAVPTFSDVATDYWAYDEIEYCVAEGIVKGYENNTYRPVNPVTRDQMAVYVSRTFIMPTGSVVVLGGPAITSYNPATLGELGWSSISSGGGGIPGFAYVMLDAARLSTDMAPLDITFELREGATPTSATVTLDATDIQDAIDAVTTSGGEPYLVVSWMIPGGLTPDDYVLVVTIAGYEMALQPEFTINEPEFAIE